jgi:hypothetical protein
MVRRGKALGLYGTSCALVERLTTAHTKDASDYHKG